jgi:serine/threonine protein kinase
MSFEKRTHVKSLSDGSLNRPKVCNITIPNIVPAKNLKLGAAIERGSFGVVRRARWFRSLVAVKVLPTVKSAQLLSFMKEKAYACGLRHPSIVATMGAVTDDFCGLIMELMSWGSLKASLNDPRRRRFFSAQRLQEGLLSICSGGAYLASVSVIHRDISSKNVFVTNGFETMKLGDFGCSELLEHHILDRKDPQYGMRIQDALSVFAGAPAYKAPELLNKRPIYSEGSDVFAFSIVAWEMLTTLWSGVYGRPWSDIGSQIDLDRAIISGKRPSLDASLYGLKNDEDEKRFANLVLLIQECWDKDPKNRPTFLQAYDKIKQFQYCIDSTAGPDHPSEGNADEDGGP